jgi:hypothetical protein
LRMVVPRRVRGSKRRATSRAYVRREGLPD